MTELTKPGRKLDQKPKRQSIIDDKATAICIEEQGSGEALDSLVISPYPYPCHF